LQARRRKRRRFSAKPDCSGCYRFSETDTWQACSGSARFFGVLFSLAYLTAMAMTRSVNGIGNRMMRTAKRGSALPIRQTTSIVRRLRS
jgi:hypothetical protein